jgi:predicted ATPase
VVRDIVEAAGAARRGSRRLILVTGSDGSGKSAVLAEMVRHLAATGIPVAQAACAPATHARPYGVVLDALNGVLVGILQLPDTSLAPWRTAIEAGVGDLDALVAALPPLAGLLGRDGSATPPRGDPSDSANAILGLLAAVASVGEGLVLLLDDAEWADPGTVDLLSRALIDAPVDGLVVVAAAPSAAPAPDALAGLTARALDEDLLWEVPIPVLGVSDVAA